MLYHSDESDIQVKVEDKLPYPIPVELYYGSKIGGDLEHLLVKDNNHLKAKDNIGYAPEDSYVDPDVIYKENL